MSFHVFEDSWRCVVCSLETEAGAQAPGFQRSLTGLRGTLRAGPSRSWGRTGVLTVVRAVFQYLLTQKRGV